MTGLHKICAEQLHNRYRLNVIDREKPPQLAQGEQIVAVPTFIKRQRAPVADCRSKGCPVRCAWWPPTTTIRNRGSEGAVLAFQALLALVQRQQITEASLPLSLATLGLRDSALGAISQSVLIAGAAGRATHRNRAGETISGHTSIGAVIPLHRELLKDRKDGTPIWNELFLTAVVDPQGRATQSVGVMRDVTAGRDAAARLLLAATLFRRSSEGFIITATSADIVKVNPAFTRICGCGEPDALGHKPCLLAPGRPEAAFFQALRQETQTNRQAGRNLAPPQGRFGLFSMAAAGLLR